MGRVTRWIRRWIVGRFLLRNPLLAVLWWLLSALRRSRRAARDIPLSPVRGTSRIGATFFARSGLSTDGNVSGEVDDLDTFARDSAVDEATADGFDPAAVDPEVRRFYEATDEYAMRLRVRWGRGFRLGARLAALLTSRIEQLNLSGGGGGWLPLSSRFVAVSVPDDPRADIRGWVRTAAVDATGSGGPGLGDAVFVALYGVHEREGERFVNIAAPLPGSNLSTVLRMRNYGDGIELTTAGDGDPGLFLVTRFGAFRLPVRQRFRTHPADGALGDGDGASGGADLVATHEMWLFRLRFLRIDYRIERRAD